VAERFVVRVSRVTAGEGRRTSVQIDLNTYEGPEIGNLSTRNCSDKLQMALHAQREVLSERPDAGNLPVRFDERDVERGQVNH